MRKTVCVDLDGVLASYKDGWKGVDHFGDPIPGAVEFTKALAAKCDVVIHTCRCNPEVNKPEAASLLGNRVRAWLDEHGFAYHDVFTGTGKPIAAAYVDDRAVVCVPEMFDPNNLVDEWHAAAAMFPYSHALNQVQRLLEYSQPAKPESGTPR